MKYPEHKQLDLVKVGEEILQFWKENQIFEQSVTTREGKETFTFYEGPPSANGQPGIHHVMARAVKDIFCRFKTLQGYQVHRKGGWDTHGLPIELQVEKELGITKEDIGKTISIADYNLKCREAVMKYKAQWEELTELMGYWVDMDNPYITYENDYIETLWSLLKRLYDKGLLYKGYTIQPYSPAAGTGLSSHELSQPGCYREVKDTSVTAQFKVLRNDRSRTLFENLADDAELFILAWTTTPWTLPSNAALAVGEKITYVRVHTFNPYTFQEGHVILAKDLVGKYFSKKQAEASIADYQAGDKVIPYQITAEFTGADLVGTQYEQLLPYVQPEGKAFEVISGDFVSTSDGTGIVHIAPTFGADDKRVGDMAGISAILVTNEDGNPAPLVDKQGRFVKEVTDFAGQYVKQEYYADAPEKSTDVLIAIKLKEDNRAFKVEKYEHSYPHCWRTDKPVLYYPLDSWFIKTTAYKDRLVALNKTINWKPASTGEGRFGNWLENLVDWNLSRSRYWGTPLPIWRTEDGTEEVCIGSMAELSEQIAKANQALGLDQPTELPDLHRPYVDEVVLVSPAGKPMKREADLIDVWFDSGAMPYAQWHYPFENHDTFQANFPADFIAEGVDQTRGWFFTLHAIATMLEDSVAFKNVIANGLVLDKDGNKMSKRLGNGIDPFETINTYGADATRWYMIENAPPWDNLKFNLEGIAEVKRRFFGTLHNTYNFFALYANLDQFAIDPQHQSAYADRPELDRWIISELQTLITEVSSAYTDYEPTRAARAVQDFTTDKLSNWYVRLCRKRFWVGDMTADKRMAYETLYECLTTLSQLIAPIAPFYADFLYQSLTKGLDADQAQGYSIELDSPSVHLTHWAEADASRTDKDLEVKMQLAQQVCSLVHSIRKSPNVQIKVRQPLSRVMVPDLDKTVSKHILEVADIIKNEVNVKSVEIMDNSTGIFKKRIKANFPELGKAFKQENGKTDGRKVQGVAKALKSFTTDDITALEQDGQYSIQLDEGQVTITPVHVLIESDEIPGWSIAKEGKLTVVLDVTLTDELRHEGIARELVNRIQNVRKDTGLNVQDKIRIFVQESSEALVNTAINTYSDYICTETQALSLSNVAELESTIELYSDELKVNFEIEKV